MLSQLPQCLNKDNITKRFLENIQVKHCISTKTSNFDFCVYAEVKAAVISGLGPVCFETRSHMIHWSQRLMNQDSERRHKEKNIKKGAKLHLPF